MRRAVAVLWGLQVRGGGAGRPPWDEPVREGGGGELRGESDDGEDEHRRKDSVRVECPLGERDQVPEAVDRADELADDSQRVSAFAIQNNAIPESSRLYHKYSASLHSVIIDAKGNAIDLHYDLTRADAEEEFSKDAEEEFSKDNVKLYLIDEILHRTVNMHRERQY